MAKMWHKTELLNILACPACGADLSADLDADGQGMVRCTFNTKACGQAYPVIDGIPRLLIGEDRTAFLERNWHRISTKLKHLLPKAESRHFSSPASQKLTARNYSRNWEELYRLLWSTPEEANRTLERSTKKLEQFVPMGRIVRSKYLLEVGCGLGRFTKIIHERSPSTAVVAMDLSEGVDYVHKVMGNSAENVLVVQASVFAMPFKRGVFDFILSYGVIHHTPDPQKAFQQCLELLAPGGEVYVWVYGDRLRQKYPLVYKFSCGFRRWHCKLPPGVLWKLCGVYGLALWMVGPVIRPLVPKHIPLRDTQRVLMDYLVNPYVHVYSREELLGWNSDNLNRFDVYKLGGDGGWVVHVTR